MQKQKLVIDQPEVLQLFSSYLAARPRCCVSESSGEGHSGTTLLSEFECFVEGCTSLDELTWSHYYSTISTIW